MYLRWGQCHQQQEKGSAAVKSWASCDSPLVVSLLDMINACRAVSIASPAKLPSTLRHILSSNLQLSRKRSPLQRAMAASAVQAAKGALGVAVFPSGLGTPVHTSVLCSNRFCNHDNSSSFLSHDHFMNQSLIYPSWLEDKQLRDLWLNLQVKRL